MKPAVNVVDRAPTGDEARDDDHVAASRLEQIAGPRDPFLRLLAPQEAVVRGRCPRKCPPAKQMLSPAIAPSAAARMTSSTRKPPVLATTPAAIAVASLGTSGKNASIIASEEDDQVAPVRAGDGVDDRLEHARPGPPGRRGREGRVRAAPIQRATRSGPRGRRPSRPLALERVEDVLGRDVAGRARREGQPPSPPTEASSTEAPASTAAHEQATPVCLVSWKWPPTGAEDRTAPAAARPAPAWRRRSCRRGRARRRLRPRAAHRGPRPRPGRQAPRTGSRRRR